MITSFSSFRNKSYGLFENIDNQSHPACVTDENKTSKTIEEFPSTDKKKKNLPSLKVSCSKSQTLSKVWIV